MKPEIREAVRESQVGPQARARQLALATLEALRSVAPECSGEEFRECARELAPGAADDGRNAERRSQSLEPPPDTAGRPQAVDDVIEFDPDSTGRQAASVRAAPTGTLMTYSYPHASLNLRPPEAAPGYRVGGRPSHEGLRMARELVAKGISMTLITEAQMALFVG